MRGGGPADEAGGPLEGQRPGQPGGNAGQPSGAGGDTGQPGGNTGRRGGGGGGGGKEPMGPPPTAAARGEGPRFGPRLTTASLIGWTALSAVVPGAAHLRAGNRRTGIALLATFGVVLVALVVLVLRLKDNAGVALRGSTMTAVMAGAAVCALAWFALVLLSFVALRPQRLTQTGQVVSGIVAGVLCVAVMAPFAFTANTIRTASQLLDDVTAPVEGSTPVPVRAEDPWNGRTRVNFLLIGGDAAGNRLGVRTDSMTVASVNIATGNTVLFSLPRNLQYVRFPPSSPLRKVFPNGFNAEGQGLLNSVWYYADNNPQVMGGKNKGAQALKDAIGYTLGLNIDYYAIVDMYGFAALIDAVGGLKIRVEQDVRWGGKFGTAGTIKAGYRTLNGEEVLWYGRSRVDSDDFSRMARQRCVIGALAQQVTPATVLANFNKIAAAARHMFRTDIPRDLLEHLVPLGMKVRSAKITSLQFVPPLIYTGNPDWVKIRQLTKEAIRQSMSDRGAVAATASPMSSAGSVASVAPSGSHSPSASPSPSPSRTPVVAGASPRRTPTTNDKAAKSLSELCGF
ncbi:LytR family transcriptional regulator [Microbispora catharanthi]|uniref:LytR family transcriptional regulator n=2 Tax=Microbispora catharanthi TaxID=1712871 RepID=A0A5N6C2N0_9ACTN|nr:LytR family transcriptional regulator [Microbispora catharanthi]